VPDKSVGPSSQAASKPAIEAALKAWIGRSNTACDAGVTPDIDANGRADSHLTARHDNDREIQN
jgi:hypothetical protein